MGNRLENKEKHTFLKYFWILFQERKKTAFDLRNFALEMKEQREQKLEHDATNVGVGSSSLSRVTNHGALADLVYAQDWKSWERGSNPRGSTFTFGSAPVATRVDCKSIV